MFHSVARRIKSCRKMFILIVNDQLLLLNYRILLYFTVSQVSNDVAKSSTCRNKIDLYTVNVAWVRCGIHSPLYVVWYDQVSKLSVEALMSIKENV